jgi:hypothetical protein
MADRLPDEVLADLSEAVLAADVTADAGAPSVTVALYRLLGFGGHPVIATRLDQRPTAWWSPGRSATPGAHGPRCSCQWRSTRPSMCDRTVRVDHAGVQRLIEAESAVLVEVLPRPEYEWAHLPDAVHLPLKGWDITGNAWTPTSTTR